MLPLPDIVAIVQNHDGDVSVHTSLTYKWIHVTVESIETGVDDIPQQGQTLPELTLYIPSPLSSNHMSVKPNVLIVGAGAVGAFYASRLPSARISVICRSNYEAVRHHGFSMKTHSFGDYQFVPANVFNSPNAAAKAGILWDYVVVTTKALPDISDDVKTIADLVTKGRTAIVLIQNGVGVEEPYKLAFPDNSIISAVTIISAAQVEPGVVVQNRWTRISLGPYFGNDLNSTQMSGTANSISHDRAQVSVREFVRMLQEGGIKDAEEYDSAGLQLVRWHKIAINASMNPSAVLSAGAGNAEMARDPELRQHLRGVMTEVLEAAPRILGRPFPRKLATADAILTSTERNTSGKPSMLLDWEKGNPMEVEVILGNPIRIARRNGIEMPRLQTLYALLRMAGQKRREGNASKL